MARPASLLCLALIAGLLAPTSSGAGESLREPATVPEADLLGSATVVNASVRGLTVHISLQSPVVRSQGGTTCRQLVVPSSNAGRFARPVDEVRLGWLVGVPDPAVARIVGHQVVERRYQLEKLCPPAAPDPRWVCELDGRCTVLRAERPPASSRIVSLTDAGSLRRQRLMRLAIRPAHRLDDHTISWLERATVTITYGVAWTLPAGGVQEPESPFATLSRQLLLNGRWLELQAEHRPQPQSESEELPSGPTTVTISTPRPSPAETNEEPAARHPKVGLPQGGRQLTNTATADPDPLQVGRSQGAATGRAEEAADLPALKIIVAEDGPVAIRGADLAAAGWPLAVLQPDRLSLSANGKPQAILVDSGVDGSFDAVDQIIFHGRAMNSEYSTENVYWLTAQESGPRFGTRLARPGQNWPVATWHPVLARFERDTVYYLSMHWQDGDDRWMWGGALGPGERITHSLELGSLAPETSLPGRLQVTVQGYTDDERVSPDHRATVWLNGHLIGEAEFDGLGSHRLAFDVRPGVLRQGRNHFTLANAPVTRAKVNQFFLNYVEIEYAGGFRASNDHIQFRAPTPGRLEFSLEGFTGAGIAVDDVTNPAQPVRLSGTEVSQAPDGSFTLRFATSADASSRFEAYLLTRAATPKHIVADEPSTWRSPDQAADYIIISHPSFIHELEPLVTHRRSQGLHVAVVSIDDIYDEFSHGVFDPRAIREFLRYASQNWRPPPPTYVLLVGEANLDYRHCMASGPPNFVPQMQVNLESGPAGSSDTWFAALDEDPLPDMLAGRISVSRAEELRRVVAKVLAYERGDYEPWRRTALWVADDEPAFDRATDEFVELLRPAYETRAFYASRFPRDGDLAAAIRGAIEDGVAVVGYVGHGNVDTWGPWPGGGRILQNRDIERLTNGPRFPILLAATCMNGWVSHPQRSVALAELWLTHGAGGGIAAWASSGLESLSAEAALLRPFLAGIRDPESQTIGALTLQAMAQAWAADETLGDTLRQYTLLGDPALRFSTSWPAAKTPQPIGPRERSYCHLPLVSVN